MGASSGEAELGGMVIWLSVWIYGKYLARVGYLLVVLAMKGRRGEPDGMDL